MNPKTHNLERGDIIALIGEPDHHYVVDYANYTRAYCLPLFTRKCDDGCGQVKEYEVVGPGINLAPDAHVHLVQDSRKSADGSLQDKLAKLARHTNGRGLINSPSMGSTQPALDTTIMQTQTTSSTRNSTRNKATNGAAGHRPMVNVPVETMKTGGRTQRAQMTAIGRDKARERATLPPSASPTPRIGQPRGSDIQHVGLCCSGSGKEVPAHRYFTPGMDARFKGWMLKLERGQMKLAELPEAVRKSYTWEGVAAEDGTMQGVIATQNYKGDDNPRYIELLAEGRTMGPVDSLGRPRVKAQTQAEEVEAVEAPAMAPAPAKATRRGGRRKAQAPEAQAE